MDKTVGLKSFQDKHVPLVAQLKPVERVAAQITASALKRSVITRSKSGVSRFFKDLTVLNEKGSYTISKGDIEDDIEDIADPIAHLRPVLSQSEYSAVDPSVVQNAFQLKAKELALRGLQEQANDLLALSHDDRLSVLKMMQKVMSPEDSDECSNEVKMCQLTHLSQSPSP